MNKVTPNVLGVHVAPTNYDMTLRLVSKSLRSPGAQYICVAAVHLLMECQKKRTLQTGVNQALQITPDGMPLVWLLRMKGHAKTERVYGPDLMIKLCSLAEQKKRSVFLLGGAPGQSAELTKKLHHRFPNLKIVGAVDTPTRPIPKQRNATILQKIRATKPDLIFVGLGCPLQEEWMIQNTPKLKSGICVGVGAAFDFISGRTSQAPVWIRNHGLEWLFRLWQEPRRLWYRYTTLNCAFLLAVTKQYIQEHLMFS